MDPSLPEATAVAVRNGRIVEVGDLEPSSGVAPSGR
jgi:predicted amidohydrolase YtcJ|tara:strand:+ start:1041 stop:1148 length:108 start_codon:yes stop_codon:yes gene_type:complete